MTYVVGRIGSDGVLSRTFSCETPLEVVEAVVELTMDDPGETDVAALGHRLMEECTVRVDEQTYFCGVLEDIYASECTLTHPVFRQLFRKHTYERVPFANLPEEFQLAMAHYMSVDGAAWAVEEDWSDWKWGEGGPDPIRQSALRNDVMTDLRRFMFRFVDHFGNIEFGVVNLPTESLMQAIRDIDDGFYSGLTFGKRDAEKWEYEIPTWPVILSSAHNDILQDGWTRFGRYYELGVEFTPCIFYLKH